jgi:MFS family permease
MVSEKKKVDFDKNIIKAYWFSFFRGLHFFSAVLIPFFILWGRISFTEIMILQAIFTFSMFLLEVPTGVVADLFGRKTSLVLASIVGVIAPLIYSSYPNFWVFAFAEFTWAIGATLISGADSALIYDSLKEREEEKKSKKVLSRYGSFGLAGIFFAALIGGLIAEYFGVRMAMMFTSAPMFIALMIALTFEEPRKHKKKQEKTYLKTLEGGIKYLRGHKELRILMFDYIIIGTLAFFIIWVYQVILQDYNLSIRWFGFVHGAIVVGEIIILNNVERIEKMFGGKKNYLTYSSIIMGFLFLVLAFVRNIYIALFSIFLIGSLGLTRKNLFSSYLNKFIESHNRATVLSVIAMFYSLSMATLDIVLGVLIDWNLKVGLIVVGVAIVVASLVSNMKEEHLLD